MNNILRGIVKEFRDKRLWPIALVLIAALVAVPVLLSKSAPAPTTVGQVPPAAAPPGTAVPAVNVQTTPGTSKLGSHSRNPFDQQGGSAPVAKTIGGTSPSATGGAPASSSATSSTPSSGSSSSAGSAPSAPSSGGSSTGSGSTSGGSTTPAQPFPTKPAKPAPAGLTDKQSYEINLSATNSSGGFDTFSPERLSPLPNQHQPLLIELGVLKGGKRVLFAVQPGTVVHGAGSCTPGAISCQILSLAPNQVESVGTNNGTVMEFAVTGIKAAGHPSASAASSARRATSPFGRRLLDRSTLTALSLFQYRPSIGAVVDLSNLTVGGS